MRNKIKGYSPPHWPEEKRKKRAFGAHTRFVCSDKGYPMTFKAILQTLQEVCVCVEERLILFVTANALTNKTTSH